MSNIHGLKWFHQMFEAETHEKANGKLHLLICDGHDSHITSSWIAHCMNNNIIFMVLPPHSSHLTQPLDVGVFKSLKTFMASAIEPLVGTELPRIMKAEWLLAYVTAHDGAFSIRNIEGGFHGTRIIPLDPFKVINHIRLHELMPALMPHDILTIQDSTPITLATSFTESIITSSPINSDEAYSTNVALLNEIATDILSTSA